MTETKRWPRKVPRFFSKVKQKMIFTEKFVFPMVEFITLLLEFWYMPIKILL